MAADGVVGADRIETEDLDGFGERKTTVKMCSGYVTASAAVSAV